MTHEYMVWEIGIFELSLGIALMAWALIQLYRLGRDWNHAKEETYPQGNNCVILNGLSSQIVLTIRDLIISILFVVFGFLLSSQ